VAWSNKQFENGSIHRTKPHRRISLGENAHKGSEMIREQQPALSLFSVGMIGLGTLSAFYRDFAFDWQPIPAFHPGRDVLALACRLFMMAASVGLLFPATAAIAARAIFPFLLAWLCLIAQTTAVLALGYQAHCRGVHELSEVELFAPTDRSYIAIFVHPIDSVSGMELFAQ
jgi:hypothetical protein